MTYPLTSLLGCKSAKVNKVVRFVFEHGQVDVGHRIGSYMYQFGIGVDINMHFAVRVDTVILISIKQSLILLEDGEKVNIFMDLRWSCLSMTS